MRHPTAQSDFVNERVGSAGDGHVLNSSSRAATANAGHEAMLREVILVCPYTPPTAGLPHSRIPRLCYTREHQEAQETSDDPIVICSKMNAPLYKCTGETSCCHRPPGLARLPHCVQCPEPGNLFWIPQGFNPPRR